MGGIKYYQLAKGEELPNEFCVVRDVDGEPSEYTFYVPEIENAELQELIKDMWKAISAHKRINFAQLLQFVDRMYKLGIEVEE